MAYRNAANVTPADGSDLPDGSCVALLIGGTGNIEITPSGMKDGSSIVINSLQAGQELKIETKRVWATNTTATDIVALY